MSLRAKIGLFCVALLFFGCAGKEPQVITRTKYQDVYIAVPCIDEMPQKPERDRSDPDNQKKIAEYFKTCEDLLKQCVAGRVSQPRWGYGK